MYYLNERETNLAEYAVVVELEGEELVGESDDDVAGVEQGQQDVYDGEQGHDHAWDSVQRGRARDNCQHHRAGHQHEHQRAARHPQLHVVQPLGHLCSQRRVLHPRRRHSPPVVASATTAAAAVT